MADAGGFGAAGAADAGGFCAGAVGAGACFGFAPFTGFGASGGGASRLKTTRSSSPDVSAAVAELYPGGTSGKDEGEVIRAVFLHLKRRNQGGNVGSK